MEGKNGWGHKILGFRLFSSRPKDECPTNDRDGRSKVGFSLCQMNCKVRHPVQEVRENCSIMRKRKKIVSGIKDLQNPIKPGLYNQKNKCQKEITLKKFSLCVVSPSTLLLVCCLRPHLQIFIYLSDNSECLSQLTVALKAG